MQYTTVAPMTHVMAAQVHHQHAHAEMESPNRFTNKPMQTQNRPKLTVL